MCNRAMYASVAVGRWRGLDFSMLVVRGAMRAWQCPPQRTLLLSLCLLGNVKLAYTSGPSLYVDTPLCFVCPTNVGIITEVPLVKPFRHGGRVEGALGDEFTTAWAGQRMGVTTATGSNPSALTCSCSSLSI